MEGRLETNFNSHKVHVGNFAVQNLALRSIIVRKKQKSGILSGLKHVTRIQVGLKRSASLLTNLKSISIPFKLI
jgi:hypothetical protein